MIQLFRETKRTQTGFTLIELLVVIAIISILSSVVITTLSTARQKSRDAKRIAQITQIERALELFYDTRQSYPSTTPAGLTGDDAGIQILATSGFMPPASVPPPGTNLTYIYRGIYSNAGTRSECTLTGTACSGFEMGITLERNDNIVLLTDADQSIGVFYGAFPDCLINTSGTDQCYDITI